MFCEQDGADNASDTRVGACVHLPIDELSIIDDDWAECSRKERDLGGGENGKKRHTKEGLLDLSELHGLVQHVHATRR